MRSLIALLLAAPAAAQAPAWTVHGDAAGDSFGFALCATGDWDGDGVVDGGDIGLFLIEWKTKDSPADFDGDGIVGGGDLGLLLIAFGDC